MADVGILAAFVAGILCFSSPCVLPLVPLYLAHLAGTGPSGSAPSRRTVLPHALAFVSGFGIIFVLLGVSLGALGGLFLVYRDWMVRVGGLVMITMGLQLIGAIRLPFLDRTYRSDALVNRPGPAHLGSSLLVGVGFAAGWTPCVGPILGAIFTLSVSAADPVRSGSLFGAYALGLAVPFLAAALALGSVTRQLRRASAGMNLASGTIMMAVGALMILGIYRQFFARIVGAAPWTPWEPTL